MRALSTVNYVTGRSLAFSGLLSVPMSVNQTPFEIWLRFQLGRLRQNLHFFSNTNQKNAVSKIYSQKHAIVKGETAEP
jgi:hypothetical protein